MDARTRMRAMDATQLAAWPQIEQREIGDDELGRILRARRQAHAARLADMETQHRRLVEEIERERQHIEHVDLLLRDLGEAPSLQESPPPVPTNGAESMRPKPDNFTPGNRNEQAPPRRPEFANVSLIDAAKRLMGTRGTMSLDDLVSEIYGAPDRDQLPIAKGSLRSAMAIGVEQGFWERERPGVFRIAPGVAGAMKT